jgi:hypothetical protein
LGHIFRGLFKGVVSSNYYYSYTFLEKVIYDFFLMCLEKEHLRQNIVLRKRMLPFGDFLPKKKKKD